ncbi:uncharacterized protein LOC106165932 [Lingula anatina]|uniref:Uncharacterized protein LOC106165932 n=1 Tax=Lingula anatina TaxID=7574 RepID=A0A1S3ING7_LINAN|nr:uncharacterized protein LOC106165932 [Lingula anatina]|eukprot:XP_013399747.1 uncharacterized protein LOC106165932 [Lingula anatina]
MAESQTARRNSAHELGQRRTQKLANTEARLVRSYLREIHSRWEKLTQEQHIIMSEWDQKQRNLWKNKRRLVLLAERIANTDRSKEAEKHLMVANLETAIEKVEKGAHGTPEDSEQIPLDNVGAKTSETVQSFDKSQVGNVSPRNPVTETRRKFKCSKSENSSFDVDKPYPKSKFSGKLPVQQPDIDTQVLTGTEKNDKIKYPDKNKNTLTQNIHSEVPRNSQTDKKAQKAGVPSGAEIELNPENSNSGSRIKDNLSGQNVHKYVGLNPLGSKTSDMSTGQSSNINTSCEGTSESESNATGRPTSVGVTSARQENIPAADPNAKSTEPLNNNDKSLDELLPKLAGMGIYSYGHGYGLHPGAQGQRKLVTKLEMFADYDGTVLDFKNNPRGRRPRTPVPRFDQIVPVGRLRKFLQKEEEKHHELIIRNKLSHFKTVSDKKLQTIDDRLQTSSFKAPRAKSAFALSSSSDIERRSIE